MSRRTIDGIAIVIAERNVTVVTFGQSGLGHCTFYVLMLRMCRHYRQSKARLSSSRRVCSGDKAACTGADSRRHATTESNCFIQLCRRRAECHVRLVSEQVCQLHRRPSRPDGISDKFNKRRINDVMSQCIQAYCTDFVQHVRLACILHHCNRSR